MKIKTAQPNNEQDKQETTDVDREAFKSHLDAPEQLIVSNRQYN